MNLEYIVKRCQGFGYATSLEEIKMKDLKEPNPKIIYLKDTETTKSPDNVDSVFTDIHDLERYTSTLTHEELVYPTVFFVEVGVPTVCEEKVDVDIPDEELHKTIDEFEIQGLEIDDKDKQTYKNCLKDFKRSEEVYVNAEFNPAFIQFLADIYMKINDTKLQRIILKILIKNDFRVDKLFKEHPLNQTSINVDTIRLSHLFDDIKVNDPYFEKSKEKLEDENTNGVMKSFSAKAIAKFNGFGNTFAQIENNKRRANLKDINILRNHAVIHSLARNRIVAAPESNDKLSIQLLMDCMSKFEHFHVIFIYPNYQYMFRYNTTPSKIMEIDSSNGNVILNVIFRYMCLNFFGMHETINHEDLYAKYML